MKKGVSAGQGVGAAIGGVAGGTAGMYGAHKAMQHPELLKLAIKNPKIAALIGALGLGGAALGGAGVGASLGGSLDKVRGGRALAGHDEDEQKMLEMYGDDPRIKAAYAKSRKEYE